MGSATQGAPLRLKKGHGHFPPAVPKAPIEPMLAKVADEIPPEGGFLFEPKWDGFRALVFRQGEEAYLQSRDLKPLNRYFPELERALAQQLPRGCVIDGEIVVVGANGLDFDALQQRLHPAASRVARLAQGNAGFVRRLRPAGGRRTLDHGAAAGRTPRPAGAVAGQRDAAAAPDADDARARGRGRLAAALRGRGAGRCRGQARRRALPARQASDVQDQARPHRGLRRGGVSLVPRHPGRGGLAVAGPLRRAPACCTTSA